MDYCEKPSMISKKPQNMIRSANKLRLIINENKIKYMRVGRDRRQVRQATGLQAGGYIFEEVKNFKYLGTNLSNTNDNHEEIKKRIISGINYAHYGLMGSKLLSKKSK